jgi:hypothetical protein
MVGRGLVCVLGPGLVCQETLGVATLLLPVTPSQDTTKGDVGLLPCIVSCY